jgi:flagella synthesis protein FlgN
MMIDSIKSFITSLKSDIKKLDVLINALESQYELLSQRDSELESHNQKMLNILNNLNETHQQRDEFMNSLGLPCNSEGLHTLCSKLPDPVKKIATELLQELTIKSKLCKALNERSGQLLANQRQLMQRLTGGEDKSAYPEINF